MANALLLGEAARLGDAQGVGALGQGMALGQDMAAQRQQMGQRNALFQQQQEDRQRQMAQEQEAKANNDILNAAAPMLMPGVTEEQASAYWQQTAPAIKQKYPQMQIPDQYPGRQALVGMLPLPPALRDKMMERTFMGADPAQAETARHNKAMEAAANQRNQNMRYRFDNPPMPKPPAGYRYTADGSALERTPGGPADQKFRAEKAEDEAALETGLASIDATIATIDGLIGGALDDPKTKRDETKEHRGLEDSTGWLDARTPTFDQDTKDAEILQDALRSQASIQGLSGVRSSSGSIGSMTQAEWPRLESLIVALQASQGTPQFKENARKYRTELGIIKSRLQKKFKSTYDGGGKMPEVQQQPQADVDALVEMYTSGNYSGD